MGNVRYGDPGELLEEGKEAKSKHGLQHSDYDASQSATGIEQFGVPTLSTAFHISQRKNMEKHQS